MSRDLILIAISLFTWGIGESAYFYFQPLYLEELGASPASIGAILGGVGIAMTLAHIPAGFLADRIGRRAMMWAAWSLGLGAGIIMAAAQSLPTFTIGILLYGVTAFVVSPMNSYITAARGKWSVGRALTFTNAAYNAGAVIGPLVGGMIGNQLGLSKIYFFAAFVFGFSTLMILFLRGQPREKAVSAEAGQGVLNSSFLRYLPLFFLVIFAMYLPQPLSQNYLQNFHDLNLNQIGKLGSAASLGTVILNLGLGALSSKLGFILGQIATGLFALLLLQGSGFPWFALGYFLLGGFRTAKALAIAQIQERISNHHMGLAFGITESVGGAALIFSPILAGYLYEINPQSVYVGAISLIGISVIASLLFTRAQPGFRMEVPDGSID